jgi:hypothetical protein
MPSYSRLKERNPEEFDAVVDFLGALR